MTALMKMEMMKIMMEDESVIGVSRMKKFFWFFFSPHRLAEMWSLMVSYMWV